MRLPILWQTATTREKREQEREAQELLRRQAARPMERVEGENQIEGLAEIERLNQLDPTLARALRSPYSPLLVEIMQQVRPEHRPVLLDAVVDLKRFNLLQPNQAMSNRAGVHARRRQWQQVAGGREGKPNYALIGGGAAVGLAVGAILGLAIPPDTLSGFSPPVLTGLAGIPLGGFLAHMLGAQDAYKQGMMQVIVNERRSIIRPEMVTGQVEAWLPKSLLAWRAHEWRYTEGRPYMWLQLPLGRQIHDVLKASLDYLLLQNDLYRASDAAVYAQRSWNRMISDSALDFADVDAGEEDGTNRIKELLPFILAGGIVLAGVLLVILTSG